ncbi:FAD dependent oxidoreductase [Cristinia sonorae]|uniref:FAD dependent oxidoreductase n=1 Tax=Cristinia sonorae TaxID=1940300 RepID=A0A8K0UTA8_9AGAR|nr:FAD dependent oxidoreductase [Cristinia sonorae]
METRSIVIIGGGIIGCTTAYYLTNHPDFKKSDTVTVIEASVHGAAQGASGKAGGLVAKWAYPKSLVNVSFPEHVRLAEKHNGKERWGWRFVGCGSWEGRGEIVEAFNEHPSAETRRKSLEKTVGLGEGWRDRKKADTGLPADLNWVKEELTETYSPMAPNGHTAQVHPYLFTTSMLELAKERGARFVSGKVTTVNIDDASRSVSGVTYTDLKTGENTTISATHVVLAAGAWSSKILPSLPIHGVRAHSITIHPQSSVSISPYVLFTDISFPRGTPLGSKPASPEIYARPDNEVYCCGTGDHWEVPLPETVDEVAVDPAACETIWQHVAGISKELREGKVDKRQACYLPTVTTASDPSLGGDPIVGEASKVAKNLFIATGHTCWGICNAPGTAKALSELILEGKITCGNIKSLSPSRFA